MQMGMECGWEWNADDNVNWHGMQMRNGMQMRM